MSAKILVVEDNPTNLKLASDGLEFEGYDILKAVDAEAAQVILAATLPDLILMDIALPGMDGLTLTRKLKAEERTRGIRIVALTAFAMKGDDQKAFDAGCDGYITKPIDMRKLPDQVAGFLARASSQSRSRRLKQDPATKHIPIVAITSAPETFSKSAALAAGCDAYIVKPVDTRKLNAQVMNTAAHQSGPPEKE